MNDVMKRAKDFIGANSWFSFDGDDDGTMSFSTREHGNVCDEEPGEADIAEARRLIKLVRDKFPSLKLSGEVVDEWVCIYVQEGV